MRALSEAQRAGLAAELGGPPLAWRWREDGALSVVSNEGRKRVLSPAELAALGKAAATPMAEEPQPAQDGAGRDATGPSEVDDERATAEAPRPGNGGESGAIGRVTGSPESPEPAKAPRKARSPR